MAGTVVMGAGRRILVLETDGPALGSSADAADLVGAAFSAQASVVAIPAQRLQADFFRLASGVAGEFVQKLVNYRLQLAVVGDIAPHAAKSAPLRDFVRESNRGRWVFFQPDLDAVILKLETLPA